MAVDRLARIATASASLGARTSISPRHGTIATTAVALLAMNVVMAGAAILGALPIVVASAATSFLIAILAFWRVGGAALLALIPLYALRYLYLAPMVSDVANATPSTVLMLRAWQTLPDAIAIMLAVIAYGAARIGRRRRSPMLRWIERFAVLGLFVVALSFLMSEAPLSSRLAYTRSFVGPIALIVLGYASRVRPRDLLVYLSASLILSVGIGAIYFAIGSATGWTWATPYFEFRHGGYAPSLGYPGIWSTVFFDVRVLRFGGGYLDPISLGYAAAVASILALRHAWWAGVLVFGLVTLATGSKGAWLVLGLGILMFLFSSSRGATLRSVSALGLIALVAALPLVADQGKGSFRVHLEGLRAGLTATAEQPFGHGLGTGGNWGSILGSGTTNTATGSESAIGAIGFQLGIPGLALTVIGLGSLGLAFVRGVGSRARSAEASLGLALVLPTFAIMLFQENSTSISAAFPIWIVLGVALAAAPRTGTTA